MVERPSYLRIGSPSPLLGTLALAVPLPTLTNVAFLFCLLLVKCTSVYGPHLRTTLNPYLTAPESR